MSEKREKRRLPVLSNTASNDESEARPEWQWVGFGVVAMLAAWLPLAQIAAYIAKKFAATILGVAPDTDAAALKWMTLSKTELAELTLAYFAPHAVALGIASFFQGFVIGRFGKGGVRAATSTAAIVAVLAALITLVQVHDLTALAGQAIVLVLAIGFGRLGASYGARRKKNSAP